MWLAEVCRDTSQSLQEGGERTATVEWNTTTENRQPGSIHKKPNQLQARVIFDLSRRQLLRSGLGVTKSEV